MSARTAIRWLFALTATIVAASLGLYLLINARCFQIGGNLTCCVKTEQKLVALSFDDGPTPQGVDALLATLNPRGIKGTFFLIGDMVARHPEQARRLVLAGHELGNHSFTHDRMVGHDDAFYDMQITRTDQLLRTAGMTGAKLFRPPYGKKLYGLPRAVARNGYRTIMWDVEESADVSLSPQAYADHLVAQVRPGSIILIHPMSRNNGTARAALPLVVDRLRAQGYRFVTVGELLSHAQR